MRKLADYLKKRSNLHQLRLYYIHLCKDLLELPQPPRGSFTRWVMDIYCEQNAVIEPCILFKPPHEINGKSVSDNKLWDDSTNLLKRIRNKGFTSELFWELIDELPTPLALPRIRCDKEKPEDPRIIHEDLLVSTALSVADLEKKTLLTSIDFQSLLDSHLQYIFHCPGFESFSAAADFVTRWAHVTLNEWTAHCKEKRYNKSCSKRFKFLQTAISPLINKGFIQHPANKEISSSSLLDKTFITSVSLLHSLKFLRRSITLRYYGSTVIDICQRLENAAFSSDLSIFYSNEESSESKALDFCEHLISIELYGTDGEMTNMQQEELLELLKSEMQNNSSTKSLQSASLLWSSDHCNIEISIKWDLMKKLWLMSYHDGDRKDSFIFNVSLLLIRYLPNEDVPENEIRGFHVAIPAALWKVLKTDLGVSVECFASPLNATLSTYFSLFWDTDKFFESQASFFDPNLQLLSGSYQLNPPFIKAILDRLIDKLLLWLDKSEKLFVSSESNKSDSDSSNVNVSCIKFTKSFHIPGPLCFALFLPDWENGAGCYFLNELQKVEASQYITAKIRVPAFEHCYVSHDGIGSINMFANYRFSSLPTLANESTHEFPSLAPSILFILQNSVGRRLWKVTDTVIHKIKSAWQPQTLLCNCFSSC